MMEALITKYWPIVLSIFAAVVWAVRVEAGTIGNRRENRRLQKQRDEDVHRQEQQRNEDLQAASDSRREVAKTLRTIEQDIKTILGSIK